MSNLPSDITILILSYIINVDNIDDSLQFINSNYKSADIYNLKLKYFQNYFNNCKNNIIKIDNGVQKLYNTYNFSEYDFKLLEYIYKDKINTPSIKCSINIFYDCCVKGYFTIVEMIYNHIVKTENIANRWLFLSYALNITDFTNILKWIYIKKTELEEDKTFDTVTLDQMTNIMEEHNLIIDTDKYNKECINLINSDFNIVPINYIKRKFIRYTILNKKNTENLELTYDKNFKDIILTFLESCKEDNLIIVKNIFAELKKNNSNISLWLILGYGYNTIINKKISNINVKYWIQRKRYNLEKIMDIKNITYSLLCKYVEIHIKHIYI